MFLLIFILSVFFLAQGVYGVDTTFFTKLLVVNSSIPNFDDNYLKVLSASIENGLSGKGNGKYSIGFHSYAKHKHILESPLAADVIQANVNVKDDIEYSHMNAQTFSDKFKTLRMHEFIDFISSGSASVSFRKELHKANLPYDNNIGIIAADVSDTAQFIGNHEIRKTGYLTSNIARHLTMFVLKTNLGDSLFVNTFLAVFMLLALILLVYYGSRYIIGLYRWKKLMKQSDDSKQASDRADSDGGDVDSVVLGDIIIGTFTSDNFAATGGLKPEAVNSPSRRTGLSDISLSPSEGSGSLPMYSACESPSSRKGIEPQSPFRSMSLENFSKAISKSMGNLTGSPKKDASGSKGGSPIKSLSPCPLQTTSSMQNWTSPRSRSRSAYYSPSHRSPDCRLKNGSPSTGHGFKPFPQHINPDSRSSPKGSSPAHVSAPARNFNMQVTHTIAGEELEVVIEEEERSKSNSTGGPSADDDSTSKSSYLESNENVGGMGLIDTIISFWQTKGGENDSKSNKSSTPGSPLSVEIDKVNLDDLNCSIY